MERTKPASNSTVLGRYRIESLLGKGGMGEVYRAYDPDLDRIVAVKTLRSEMADPQLLDRFRREGRAAGRLRHPFIVTVYDLGEAEGTVFLAMEYLEGRSLAAALQEGLSFSQKLRVLAEVLDGLEYAHSQGVVHRDVKPGNIQVLPDGSIKILDFGVARILTSDSLSQTGSVVGTVLYMSPEQLRGERVDHRADIYSTGVVAYELLTRRRPFEGHSLTEVCLKIVNEPLPPMNNAWSEAFPQVERIVTKAVSKAAADRYASAGEMAAAVRDLLGREERQIARMEDDLQASSGADLRRARKLAAQGKLDDSLTLLVDAAGRNPDATDITLLIADLQARQGASAEPVAPSPPGTAQTVRPPRPAPPPPVSIAPRTLPGPAVEPARSSRRSGARAILLGAALFVALGLGAAQVLRRPDPPPVRPGSSPRGPVTPIPVEDTAPRVAPAGAPPTTVAPERLPRRATSEPPRSAVPPEPRSVFVAAAAANRDLAFALREALQARGFTLRDRAAESAVVVRVEAEITVRPAPFAAASARTADYVGRLEVRRGAHPPQHHQMDGHAMEFGDTVARAAAIRELADRMAARIESDHHN